MDRLEDKLNELNAKVDAAADKRLADAQRSKWTGVAILLVIILAVAAPFILWFML